MPREGKRNKRSAQAHPRQVRGREARKTEDRARARTLSSRSKEEQPGPSEEPGRDSLESQQRRMNDSPSYRLDDQRTPFHPSPFLRNACLAVLTYHNAIQRRARVIAA